MIDDPKPDAMSGAAESGAAEVAAADVADTGLPEAVATGAATAAGCALGAAAAVKASVARAIARISRVRNPIFFMFSPPRPNSGSDAAGVIQSIATDAPGHETPPRHAHKYSRTGLPIRLCKS